MKIIWLTTEVPFPAIGGRNGTYHRIKQIGKNHTIYLFSISYSEEEETAAQTEMSRYCKELYFYNRSSHKFRSIIECMFLPHCVATRDNSQLKKELLQCAERHDIDIVILDFPHMLPDIMPLHVKYPHIPITLHQHNIEYKTMRSVSKAGTMTPVMRFVWLAESFRLEWYEKLIYHFNIVKAFTFFSKDDKIFFQKYLNYKNAVLEVIPLGADCPLTSVPPSPLAHTMLFVGKMSSEVNTEAAVWLCRKVLPLVQKEIPDIRLVIAGASPSPKVQALSSESVIIAGGYDTPDKFYHSASIVVIPVFYGGGVKGKLLEAVSFKRPVITTQHGAMGTNFINGKHILVRDTCDSFARACIDVLKNPEAYEDMVNQAFVLFYNAYSWEIIGKNYDHFLNKLIADTKVSS